MTWEISLPVITFVLGYGLTMVTEWARAKFAYTARQREAGAQFQRSTLLEAQDTLTALIDAAQDCHRQRRDNRDGKIDAEVHDRTYTLHLEASKLMSRVRSDSLRHDIDQIVMLSSHLAFGPSEDTDVRIEEPLGADNPALDLMGRVGELNAAIGDELRALHGL